jgi:TolB-like protein/tetratricopeptide (TPR) repeat protein
VTRCEMYRFEGYTLDAARCSLRAADRVIELRPKAFEVLRFLVENAGRVVTKEEFIKAIWPDVVVTDESLTHCVSEARNAIGDTSQAIIKTVPRQGYRFVAPVSRLLADATSEPQSAPVAASGIETKSDRALPDRPSIAVLPFTNIGGDPEQEYFADGMVEEIITALSRMRWLFVIARNSSFAYKGRYVDVKQVGRELGVRYVLEGSVRKAGDMVRITRQLIDASTGVHIWADRFDGTLEDVFDLQDQVTASVVGAVAPNMEQAEIQRAKRKPTENLHAYDYFLHGMAMVHEWTGEATNEALRLFYKAIEIDPDFASAYGMAAWCYGGRKANRWASERPKELAEGTRLARKAVGLARDDAVALAAGGYVLAYVTHDLDAGSVFIDRALTLNPNLANAWHAMGMVKTYLGEPEAALQHLAHTVRLSPFDSQMPNILAATAFAHFFMGDFDKASFWAAKALHEKLYFHPALRYAAVSNALAGRLMDAQEAMARLRQIDPALRISNLKEMTPLRRPDDRARYEEGMRKAGLPE